MESNNSSSNTATAFSSDPPPPNQRNDDKGKQTCSNESEANNNPDSSVLKPGNKGRSSQYTGVTLTRGGWTNSGDRWVARLSTGRKQLHLGMFGTKKEAAEAYDIAVIRLKDLIPGERELNFDLQNYNTEKILKCSKIPIGEGASRLIKELTVEEFLRKNNIEIVKMRTKNEENENKNNNSESSVLEAGDQRKSSSCNDGFVCMDDNEYDDLLPDGFFEKGFPWNNDDQWPYSELLMTEDNHMSFADNMEEPPQPSGGSSSKKLYHPIEAENQTVANSEGLFGYREPLMNEPLMEHLVSGNYSLNDFKDLDSTEDVEMSFADEDPAS